MAIQRWDPWSEMLTLREAMNQLLQDSYVRPGATGGPTADAPALDVFEDADNIEVSASLPGLRPEDVDITIQGDMLTIKGQRKEQAERKQGSYLVREQRSGAFYRSIQLPVMVDSNKAQAQFEHGVLHLTLPKAESTKPRQIRINAGQGQTVDQPQQQQLNAAPANGKHEPVEAGSNKQS
jgi:HSP20 family protein